MKNKFTLYIFLFITLLISPTPVSADTAPKPTMKFNIHYETQNQITLLGGEQYQCEDKNCEEIKALGEYGPQRFTCENNSCSSLAYGYSPYQKLVLNFSDKTRESQIIHTEAFNAEFNVKVTDSSLIIEETTPITSRGRVPSFIKALIITLILELLVALIYLSITKISKRILLYVLIANVISLPIVWFLFPSIKITSLVFLMFVLSEIFAVVFEAYFIYHLNKKIISLRKSFVLSTIMNLVSLFVGGFIFSFFLMMF
jgi:hypothetical protein